MECSGYCGLETCLKFMMMHNDAMPNGRVHECFMNGLLPAWAHGTDSVGGHCKVEHDTEI